MGKSIIEEVRQKEREMMIAEVEAMKQEHKQKLKIEEERRENMGARMQREIDALKQEIEEEEKVYKESLHNVMGVFDVDEPNPIHTPQFDAEENPLLTKTEIDPGPSEISSMGLKVSQGTKGYNVPYEAPINVQLK